MAERLYDRTEALERLGHDEGLLDELLGMFAANGPAYLGAIDAAHRDGDLDALARAAHSLKGALATFSAGAALNAALALEHHAKERAPADIIDTLVAVTKLETERFLASLAPA